MPRFGTERLLLVGLAVAFVGYLLPLRASPSMPYVEFLFPTIICTGTAVAIVFPAVNIQATAGLANTEQGEASGIVNTSMQLGGALRLAVASAVLGTSSVTAQHRQLLPHMDAALSAHPVRQPESRSDLWLGAAGLAVPEGYLLAPALHSIRATAPGVARNVVRALRGAAHCLS